MHYLHVMISEYPPEGGMDVHPSFDLMATLSRYNNLDVPASDNEAREVAFRHGGTNNEGEQPDIVVPLSVFEQHLQHVAGLYVPDWGYGAMALRITGPQAGEAVEKVMQTMADYCRGHVPGCQKVQIMRQTIAA